MDRIYLCGNISHKKNPAKGRNGAWDVSATGEEIAADEIE
jgi:hypothetical protein